MKTKIAAVTIAIIALQTLGAKADQYSDYNSEWNQNQRRMEQMAQEHDHQRSHESQPSQSDKPRK